MSILNNTTTADTPALYWEGELHTTYSQLREDVSKHQSRLQSDNKRCVLLYLENHPVAVSALLAALQSNHAVMLADPKLPSEHKTELEARYQPHWIGQFSESLATWHRTIAADYDIASPLSLLLSTSGSTGSPKYVKLAGSSVTANAHAIGESLDIKPTDVAAAHLDFHYSYGLSVLTSHLSAGASLSMTNGKFTDRNFWQATRAAGVTHLPGVPLHYEIMTRLGLKRLNIPTVKVMTQAGGRLAENIRDQLHEFMEERNGQFFVMYGQTEAAPRMSTLQHKDYPTYKNTVGTALPGGGFTVVDDNQKPLAANQPGEILYRGPNVMMGYATSFKELAIEDTQSGQLHTGDIGMLNPDGFLTITGRISRFGKIFGWRVNLDEIETFVGKTEAIFCIETEGCVGLVIESDASNYWDDKKSQLTELLCQQYSLPHSAYRYFVIPKIPTNARGKTDYQEITKLVQEIQTET